MQVTDVLLNQLDVCHGPSPSLVMLTLSLEPAITQWPLLSGSSQGEQCSGYSRTNVAAVWDQERGLILLSLLLMSTDGAL